MLFKKSGIAVCLGTVAKRMAGSGCRVHASGRNVDGRGSTRCHCTKTYYLMQWAAVVVVDVRANGIRRRHENGQENGTMVRGKIVGAWCFLFSCDSAQKKKHRELGARGQRKISFVCTAGFFNRWLSLHFKSFVRELSCQENSSLIQFSQCLLGNLEFQQIAYLFQLSLTVRIELYFGKPDNFQGQ